MIAENLYSQVDSEGHQHLVLKDIDDHERSDEVVDASDGFTTSRNRKQDPGENHQGLEVHDGYQ